MGKTAGAAQDTRSAAPAPQSARARGPDSRPAPDGRRRIFRRVLSVEQALELVERAAARGPAPVEPVALCDAQGRVLAADVRMDHDVPPFRRAAMDGYAVADAAPAGARFRVVGRVAAGEAPAARLRPGEAVRVMTGAPVPEGAGRVLPFEHTEAHGAEVVVRRAAGPETHVVEPGAHVRAGTRVLAAGTRLSPGAVGVLATAGVSTVPVAARPRVAVLATGSELVEVDALPGPAQIRNSNNPTLRAQAQSAGALVLDLGVARDEPGALTAALARGLSADVLLVSGGVSAGDLDLVPGALGRLQVEAVFHGWAVQPGGPLWFGTRGGTAVFALPGNPAASFVGFEILVRPLLGQRQGLPFDAPHPWRARWHGVDPGPHARRRFRPVRLEPAPGGSLRALPVPWKGSGDPFALGAAEALAELPEAGLPGPESEVGLRLLGGALAPGALSWAPA